MPLYDCYYIWRFLTPKAQMTAPHLIPKRKLLLNATQHDTLYSALDSLFKEQKVYKNKNLNVDVLAVRLGSNRHYISETLNVYGKKTFYEFLNTYRIHEVTTHLDQQLQKAQKISLLSICMESGFSNKASFNQYFKKIHGMTPSAYVKEKKVAIGTL